MYLIVLSNDVQAVSDNKIKEYISDMALVLHGIAQSKVINNSLISSYDVLQKILDNIGSGIIVCSRYSGNILFENEMAPNVQGGSGYNKGMSGGCVYMRRCTQKYRSIHGTLQYRVRIVV